MKEITRRLKTDIPISAITQIEDWWQKLSIQNQEELRELYLNEDRAKGEMISIYLCGKFVEQDRQYQEDIFWINHFYDYIINHELFEDFNHPSIGGICSAVNKAEKSIRKGLFPADYLCPLQKDNCPIEQILKRGSGKSFELYLLFKREKGNN